MSRAFCSVRSSKISDFRFLADFKTSLEISSDSRRVYEISGRVYEISASDVLSYIIFLSFNFSKGSASSIGTLVNSEDDEF